MRLCGLALGALVSSMGCLGHKAASPARTVQPESNTPVTTVAPETTAPAMVAALPAATAVPPADTFTTAVRPILAQACAPCHNPGGKMYARLPFDEPKVVREHEKGVRKRLKGENLEVFERWLTPPAEK
jgi:hypothetical protein